MSGAHDFLSQPVVQQVGWSLIHFVWQGAAVALVLAGVLFLLRRRSANARYLAASAALLLMMVSPALTLSLQFPSRIVELREQASAAAPGGGGSPLAPDWTLAELRGLGGGTGDSAPSGSRAWTLREVRNTLEARLGWIVAGWATGVLFLSLRLILGLANVQRIRRSGFREGCGHWQEMMTRIANRLQMGRPVTLLRSVLARAPIAVGWLRPAILLPAGVLTGLPPEQVEAILAHELAHIRRHDYLVNLFQTAAEMLLFYHPAVYWVSHRIRTEREHCCDDLAVCVCGDSVTCARALTRIAELDRAPSPAVAASGGQLLGRIRRLLGMRAPRSPQASRWLAGVIGFGLLLAVGAGMVAGPVVANTGEVSGASVTTPTEDDETEAAPEGARQFSEMLAGIVTDEAGEPIEGAMDEVSAALTKHLSSIKSYTASYTLTKKDDPSFLREVATGWKRVPGSGFKYFDKRYVVERWNETGAVAFRGAYDGKMSYIDEGYMHFTEQGLSGRLWARGLTLMSYIDGWYRHSTEEGLSDRLWARGLTLPTLATHFLDVTPIERVISNGTFEIVGRERAGDWDCVVIHGKYSLPEEGDMNQRGTPGVYLKLYLAVGGGFMPVRQEWYAVNDEHPRGKLFQTYTSKLQEVESGTWFPMRGTQGLVGGSHWELKVTELTINPDIPDEAFRIEDGQEGV